MTAIEQIEKNREAEAIRNAAGNAFAKFFAAMSVMASVLFAHGAALSSHQMTVGPISHLLDETHPSADRFGTESNIPLQFAQGLVPNAEGVPAREPGNRSFVPDLSLYPEDIPKTWVSQTKNVELQTIPRPLRRPDYLKVFLGGSDGSERKTAEVEPVEQEISRPRRHPGLQSGEAASIPEPEPVAVSSGSADSSPATLESLPTLAGISRPLKNPAMADANPSDASVTPLVEVDRMPSTLTLTRPIRNPAWRRSGPGQQPSETPPLEDVQLALADLLRPTKNPAFATSLSRRVSIPISTRPITRPTNLRIVLNRSSSNESRTQVIRVAALATQEDALELGKLNLLGVYGSESRRRALVRMPSGKMEKIQVGQTFNGGRVVAIGSNSLTYIKNSRNYVLKIPE